MNQPKERKNPFYRRAANHHCKSGRKMNRQTAKQNECSIISIVVLSTERDVFVCTVVGHFNFHCHFRPPTQTYAKQHQQQQHDFKCASAQLTIQFYRI